MFYLGGVIVEYRRRYIKLRSAYLRYFRAPEKQHHIQCIYIPTIIHVSIARGCFTLCFYTTFAHVIFIFLNMKMNDIGLYLVFIYMHCHNFQVQTVYLVVNVIILICQ